MTREVKHSSFFKNALWQYGLQFIKHLLPLIMIPYLTRVLEPSGYAVYAYVIAFMQFMQIFIDFGFNLSGTKKIAKADGVEDANKVIGAVTEARLLLCGIGLLFVLGVSIFLPILHENLLYTILAYVAVCGRGLAPDFLFQGKEKMGPITTRYFLSKGTSTALTFVLVHSFADILWVPILDILASAIALTWSMVSAKRLFGTTISLVPLGVAFDELKVSGLYCLSNMASSAFNGFTTLIIGVALTESADISYWSLAMTSITAVQTLFTPITNSLYPRMVTSGDYSFAVKLGKIALPVLVVGTIAYVALADIIVLILGGESYLPGSFVLVYTSPVLIISYYGMSFGWPVLGADGHVKEMTASTVTAGLFSVCSLLCLWGFGLFSLVTVSVVRVLTEALMASLRLGGCYKYGLLSGSKVGGND